jgi:hypothetical protein
VKCRYTPFEVVLLIKVRGGNDRIRFTSTQDYRTVKRKKDVHYLRGTIKKTRKLQVAPENESVLPVVRIVVIAGEMDRWPCAGSG